MLGDTIVAQASAAGGSERAVVRLSGPAARPAAQAVFTPDLPAVRACVEGRVRVGRWTVPAFALVMPGPRSFTGEDVVELHVPGSALLVQRLLADLVHDGPVRGVRLALPGEFTARAVQNGRLDGGAVEGLLMLLHGHDARELAHAVSWLRGGAAAAVADLRARLQDTLALLEVGLDFDDGETGAVPEAAWRAPLQGIAAAIGALAATVPAAAPGGDALLLGRANAGKSSLGNALAGRPCSLVDAVAGTTRDLLRVVLPEGGVVWDAPGDLDAPGDVDAQALALRDRLGGGAVGVLIVLDRQAPFVPSRGLATTLAWLAVVWTKCDDGKVPPLPAAIAMAHPDVPVFATSARTGIGIEPLRTFLARLAQARVVDVGGPVRRALQAAQAAVERALVASGGPELVAVELQAALQALDGIAGHHSAEDLLDRIYGRFCLGK